MPSSATVADLLAEKTRLEALLDASDDWRLLQQLEAYDEGGRANTPLLTDATRARLRLSLAENPFFQQRDRVLAEIDRRRAIEASNEAAAQPAHLPLVPGTATVAPQTPPASPPRSAPMDFGAAAHCAPSGSSPTRRMFATSEDVDDLTRIHGIDHRLAVALNELGVLNYAQIRDWSDADVAIVRFALKLGRRISAENWIEQAAMLSANLTSDQVAVAEALDEDPGQTPVVLPQAEPSTIAEVTADQPALSLPTNVAAVAGTADDASEDDASASAHGHTLTDTVAMAKPPLPLPPSAYQTTPLEASAPQIILASQSATFQSATLEPDWPLPEAARVPGPMTCAAFPAIAVTSTDSDAAMINEGADPFGDDFSDDGHLKFICARADDWETGVDEAHDDRAGAAPADQPITVAPPESRDGADNERGIDAAAPVPDGSDVDMRIAMRDEQPLAVGRIKAVPAAAAQPPAGTASGAPSRAIPSGRPIRPLRPLRAPVTVRPAAIGQSDTEATVEIVRHGAAPAEPGGQDQAASGQPAKPLARFVSRLLKGGQ